MGGEGQYMSIQTHPAIVNSDFAEVMLCVGGFTEQQVVDLGYAEDTCQKFRSPKQLFRHIRAVLDIIKQRSQAQAEEPSSDTDTDS
jgi:hypothetical protein